MTRPRSEEARRKALTAAADLIIERGVAALSIEEVAARSGVAKTTIYRHWPERASLIVDTMRGTFEHIGAPDTGSVRADFLAYFDGMIRSDLDGRVGRLMPCLIEAAARDEEVAALMSGYKAERAEAVRAIVARAVARGELSPDVDPAVVVGTVIGPVVFRKVVQGEPVDRAYVEACLDIALAGLGAERH